MIDYNTLISDFETLVGFRQTNDISLSASLQTSDSGLYTDALPGISLELIESIIENQSEVSTSGSIVVGNWYQISDNSGGADFTTTGSSDNNIGTLFKATSTNLTWGTGSLTTQPVIDYLNLVRNDEIQSVIRQWVALMSQYYSNQSVKWKDKLINHVGSVKKPQRETAKGFYINLSSSNTLSMVIKSISLQLSQIDTVRLYLYEFGKTEAVYTFDYVSLDNEQIQFQTLTDWVLKYTSNDNAKKEYLLLYYDYDPDNTQSAIQLESDTEYITSSSDCFDNEPDSLRYVYFSPVVIPKRYWNWNATSSNYDIPNLENRKPLSFCSDGENGINIDFNIDCDITQIIIDNRLIFAKLLQYSYAIRILSDTDTSHRANRIKRQSESYDTKYLDIYKSKLYGDAFLNKNDKLIELDGELLKLVKDFENIDNECFVNKTNKTGFIISNCYQNPKR
jgi:hypothetical protein